MSNSTQSKLSLLALLQKKYLCTCKNIATKLNFDEFLCTKLFEQYRIEDWGNKCGNWKAFIFQYFLFLSFFFYLFTYFLCVEAVTKFCYQLAYLFSFCYCCVLMLLIFRQ